MYFVLVQFVCSHAQLCSFLFFLFIVMLYICDQLVSSIHQHHIDVPLNISSCLCSLGRGMSFSYIIHFPMKLGSLYHHVRSESSHYKCYFKLTGCRQYLPKVGGDLW